MTAEGNSVHEQLRERRPCDCISNIILEIVSLHVSLVLLTRAENSIRMVYGKSN